jgi:hypothetical protein
MRHLSFGGAVLVLVLGACVGTYKRPYMQEVRKIAKQSIVIGDVQVRVEKSEAAHVPKEWEQARPGAVKTLEAQGFKVVSAASGSIIQEIREYKEPAPSYSLIYPRYYILDRAKIRSVLGSSGSDLLLVPIVYAAKQFGNVRLGGGQYCQFQSYAEIQVYYLLVNGDGLVLASDDFGPYQLHENDVSIFGKVPSTFANRIRVQTHTVELDGKKCRMKRKTNVDLKGVFEKLDYTILEDLR